MVVPSLFENRSFHHLTAALAAATILLATLPSRADDELAALGSLDAIRVPGLEPGARFSVEPDEPAPEPGEAVPSAPAPASDDHSLVTVSLERIDNHETVALAIPRDGLLSTPDAQAIAHFLRCRRTKKQHTINPGVLALLADVAAHWPERPIQIVSGFRARPFGVPHSRHFKGQAIDLRIPGVRTTVLRDYVWSHNHGVGVGYYQRENFVHMDWRPEAQDRAWTGADEGGPVLLNPRWARKARRSQPTQTITPETLAVPYALHRTTGAGTL
jgi:uncharacterized protein YcbK (DUF882 family)